ncbi:MAG: hypothetical protein M3414_02100 [Pseudomonadota bacterium]|nr:hypothetical protein [Pseudomonadota bacterium]
MNTSDTDPRPAKASQARNLIIMAVVVAALLILGVYLWGNVQTRNQLSAQQTEHDQSISTLQERLQTTERELAATRNRNLLLMARTDLYRAAAALDQRNFGIANTHLRQVEQALGKVDAASAGLDVAGLNQLRSSLDGLNINVATDLQDQRNQVLSLASQLDAIALDTGDEAATR